MLGFLKKPWGKFWFVVVAWKLEELGTAAAAAWLPHFTKFSLGFWFFFWSLWTALIATFFLSSVSSFTCWSWVLHFCMQGGRDTRKSVVHESMSSVSEEELQL